MADPTQAQTYLAVLDDGHRIERIAGCRARAAMMNLRRFTDRDLPCFGQRIKLKAAAT
jgi:hypothetical protein